MSYGGKHAEEMAEEYSGLTKYIYDVSTDDGMFLYQILKSPGLSQEERKMEITLLLSDMLDWDSRLRTVCSVSYTHLEGKQENDAGVGAGALRLYCAGTVFAGISILMAGYFQVCGRERSDRDRPRSPAPFRRVWRRIRPALFHVCLLYTSRCV